MRTSEQWWQEVKADPEKLISWLKKQFHGETTAAERIERYCMAKLDEDDSRQETLKKIASQERMHASWVGDLLKNRGITPAVLEKGERYWEKVLSNITSFEQAAGVAHHAEVMRLERIAVIAHDTEAPSDIRAVFACILDDERFHARAFRDLAGPEAVANTHAGHLEGAEAIGFVTAAEA